MQYVVVSKISQRKPPLLANCKVDREEKRIVTLASTYTTGKKIKVFANYIHCKGYFSTGGLKKILTNWIWSLMGTGNCVPIYWQTKKGMKYVRHAYFDQNANELLPTGKSSCK